MREFNTSGPCDPALHYTVMRRALMAKGLEKVRKGRYFTIFAPRQTGKTTYFQLLMEDLVQNGFLPVWISLENLKTATREQFYKVFGKHLSGEFLKQKLLSEIAIQNQFDIEDFFAGIRKSSPPVVLIIDEFEGIPDCVLSEVMHTFRLIYHKKENRTIHSLILVGVSTIAELVVSHASPFNIAEELEIPYFTFGEVRKLIGQHMTESGQVFEDGVISAVYENTKGQPGLVCAICRHLVETSGEERPPITMKVFYAAMQFFLTKKLDKNILNIVQKAREKRDFMIRLLFDEDSTPFTVDDPDIAFLQANGVVDEQDGFVHIPVPLYAKRLINAFRPLLNGETRHYAASVEDTMEKYKTSDGGLNVNALLDEYGAYVRRRGFRAFDTDHLKEAAWHYSLDGFITFFIRCLEGQTFVEVPTGKGRADILILLGGRKYVIETKRFVNNHYFQKGKGQLAQYLKSENIAEGYYVVFSNRHTDKDTLRTQEQLEGRQIHTHIIPVKFEVPSRMPVPEELRLTKEETIAVNMLRKGFSTEDIAEITGASLERVEKLAPLFRKNKP